MTQGPSTELSRQLRERRLALRAELSATAHWRRLLRAKIDLTVARGAPPKDLDPLLVEDRACAARVNSALHDSIIAAVASFPLVDLPALRQLDRELAQHESALRSELMSTTDQLVEHLTAPTASQ